MKEFDYNMGDTINVEDLMQKGSYVLSEPIGKNFSKEFTPHFTPQEMLKLGVFEGKYLNDCQSEFPEEWFKEANISKTADISFNFFKIKSRQPLSYWIEKDWIIEPDPRGWFQWYCRYYLGRRLLEVDKKQIKRWKAFNRHAGQVKANCMEGDLSCRPRQRQALLQWSHDPFI